MSFYSNIAKTAKTLIKSKGQDVTLSRKTNDSFDPVSGKYISEVETTWTGYGVATNYNQNETKDNILKDDIKLIINNVSTKPKAGDNVLINTNDKYYIVSVLSITPAATDIIYILQLRK